MGVFAIFYGLTNLPWEFLSSFMNIQTCHGSFCHLLWTDKPAMGVFAIFYHTNTFYEHTNLPWEFLSSFMNIQTCHGSFCHLLWTDKPAMGVFVIFYGHDKPAMGVFVIFYEHTNLPWEFAIFYGQTNLPWEFLPSFMNIQTCHGSFCHLLWA